MKKAILFLLILCLLPAAAALGEADHEHVWGEWQYDEMYHWHSCTVCNKNEELYIEYTTKDGYPTASAGNVAYHLARCTDTKSAVCSVCGAKDAEIMGYMHGKPVWKSDETQHWQECADCGAMIKMKGKHTAPCGAEACTECGRSLAYCQAELEHDYEYAHDAESHWLQCSRCGTTASNGEHTASCFHPDTCLTCGAAAQEGALLRVTHSTGYDRLGTYYEGCCEKDDYHYDAIEHWNVCKNTGERIWVSAHTDDGSGKCQVCGAPIGEAEMTLEEKVKQIIASVITPGMSDYMKARRLHDYICTYASYDYTYSHYSAEDILLRGTGVCQAYTGAYATLLSAVGIASTTARGENHIWNVIRLNGKWYHVDVTWDDSDGGGYSYVFFCVTDAGLKNVKNHENFNPAVSCTDYKGSYIYRSKYLREDIEAARQEIQRRIDAGETDFSVDVPSDVYGVSGNMLMEGLQDQSFTRNGKPAQLRLSSKFTAIQYTLHVTVSDTLRGDVTGDGKIDIMDVIRLLKSVSGWDVQINKDAAEVTGDSDVTIMDVIRLLKYVSGWQVSLG